MKSEKFDIHLHSVHAVVRGEQNWTPRYWCGNGTKWHMICIKWQIPAFLVQYNKKMEKLSSVIWWQTWRGDPIIWLSSGQLFKIR